MNLISTSLLVGLASCFVGCKSVKKDGAAPESGRSGETRTDSAGDAGETSAMLVAPTKKPVLWFIPNQLAGNLWWSVNGHLSESFGDFSRWSTLRANLIR